MGVHGRRCFSGNTVSAGGGKGIAGGRWAGGLGHRTLRRWRGVGGADSASQWNAHQSRNQPGCYLTRVASVSPEGNHPPVPARDGVCLRRNQLVGPDALHCQYQDEFKLARRRQSHDPRTEGHDRGCGYQRRPTTFLQCGYRSPNRPILGCVRKSFCAPAACPDS